jgi:8-oxo-dGTP diphosphatase
VTATTGRQRAQVDVHLILRRGDTILLGQRINTGWADGHWHLPAGHGEEHEPALTTLVREAREELGIVIAPGDARLVHVLHHLTESSRFALFFDVTDWTGEPANTEPHKCAGWQWYPLDDLPTPMIGYARQALTAVRAGRLYSELGWTR